MRNNAGFNIAYSQLFYSPYLPSSLDGDLALLSTAANQRRGFMEILHCDSLPPKVLMGSCSEKLLCASTGPN